MRLLLVEISTVLIFGYKLRKNLKQKYRWTDFENIGYLKVFLAAIKNKRTRLIFSYFNVSTFKIGFFQKTLMLGRIEGRRRRGWQRMRWLDGITASMEWAQGVGDGQWSLACCSPWGHRVGHIWATKLNWNSLMNNQKWYLVSFCSWVISFIVTVWTGFSFSPTVSFSSWPRAGMV